jgi:hypothetical protein
MRARLKMEQAMDGPTAAREPKEKS